MPVVHARRSYDLFPKNNGAYRSLCTEPTDDQREQLSLFAGQPKSRIIGRYRKGMPSDWCPHKVINPETGFPFSDASAWELIQQLLDGGHPIQPIPMDNPSGITGYVMKHQLKGEERLIYIKVHFGNGKIVGRSFHYDY